MKRFSSPPTTTPTPSAKKVQLITLQLPPTPDMERRQAFLEEEVNENYNKLRESGYDREFVLAAVNKNGFVLRHASDILRADKRVVLAAVNNDGFALQFASVNLQADKDVVMAAVDNNSCALQFASVHLRADKDVVLAAVASDVRALEYVSRDLLDCSTINDNLHFVGAVIQACSVFEIRYFPGLKGILYTLYQKLQESCHKGNGHLQPECHAHVLPQVLAKQWLVRLLETQWCFGQVCKKGLLTSDDIQLHIRNFSDLPSDFQTAGLLQAYAPIICSVLEKRNNRNRNRYRYWYNDEESADESADESWLGLLEGLAHESDVENKRFLPSTSESDDSDSDESALDVIGFLL